MELEFRCACLGMINELSLVPSRRGDCIALSVLHHASISSTTRLRDNVRIYQLYFRAFFRAIECLARQKFTHDPEPTFCSVVIVSPQLGQNSHWTSFGRTYPEYKLHIPIFHRAFEPCLGSSCDCSEFLLQYIVHENRAALALVHPSENSFTRR